MLGADTHVLHEALAAKDVYEEVRGILDVSEFLDVRRFLKIYGLLNARRFLNARAGLLTGHLVADDAQVLSQQIASNQIGFQAGKKKRPVARMESDSTRYALLAIK